MGADLSASGMPRHPVLIHDVRLPARRSPEMDTADRARVLV